MTQNKVDHYTPLEVVIECLNQLPIQYNDIIVDAGSGPSKIWYNNINTKIKYECEIEDGNDFLKFNKSVDWVIGNPPFKDGWDFTFHASTIAKKGIGFLGSVNFVNSNFIPSRIKKMEENSFGIVKIHMLNIQKWYGRYFFIVYEKDKPGVISYNIKNFK